MNELSLLIEEAHDLEICKIIPRHDSFPAKEITDELNQSINIEHPLTFKPKHDLKSSFHYPKSLNQS